MTDEPLIYFTPTVQARALAYMIAVSRGDVDRDEVFADLDGDELHRTVETLALTGFSILQRITGQAETVLSQMLEATQQEILDEQTEGNDDE